MRLKSNKKGNEWTPHRANVFRFMGYEIRLDRHQCLVCMTAESCPSNQLCHVPFVQYGIHSSSCSWMVILLNKVGFLLIFMQTFFLCAVTSFRCKSTWPGFLICVLFFQLRLKRNGWLSLNDKQYFFVFRVCHKDFKQKMHGTNGWTLLTFSHFNRSWEQWYLCHQSLSKMIR